MAMATDQFHPIPKRAGQAIPANYESPLETPASDPGSSMADGADWAREADRPAGFDRFTYVQERLRRLGATHYTLTTWGDAGELYRFECRVAVDGNPDYNRHFEARDGDALQAMSDVLTQVETWNASRR